MELAFQILAMFTIICCVYSACGVILFLVLSVVDIEKVTTWLFKDKGENDD